jgi:hypothetical protein
LGNTGDASEMKVLTQINVAKADDAAYIIDFALMDDD